MKRRIHAVIVLYRCKPEDSISFTSLLRSARQAPADELDLSVTLHDNTPAAIAPAHLPTEVLYVQDAGNSGLTAAYNQALARALEQGCEWLLTLDQDTELPPETLSVLLRITAELEARPEVAAVVPQINSAGRAVSPNYFAAGGWPRWFPKGYNGTPDRNVYAFNSASLLRVSALRQIGGYSPWFWLDNSDSYLYRQLSRFAKRVYVAGALQVEHDFSLLNLQARVSPQRYSDLLLSESAFWDMEMNALAGLERTARLAGRLLRHRLRHDSQELRELTKQALRRRLRTSRQQRIAHWKQTTEARFGAALQIPALTGPAAVSVCMATYNGERYIEAQLRSILPQLKSGDEVIIVDDCSRDRTVAAIRRMQRELDAHPAGPRILLIQHSRNQGVVQTFEDAIRGATGDILFLCDHDDLWAPDKVRRVLQVFATHPETQVVSTGLALIDEHDQPMQESEYLKSRKFTTNLAANILHNQFQGSAMAFRSTLIRHILPLPTGRLFLHDAWIGTRNILAGGKTMYIDEPLLLYRRHAANFSRPFNRRKQLWLRLQFVAAHLRWAFHRI